MKPVIESLFHDAGSHYLKPDAMVEVGQYMSSLKERTRLYRTIRDQEVTWMQPIADDLEQCFPPNRSIAWKIAYVMQCYRCVIAPWPC